MSDIEVYDARVQAIRAYNQPLLENFRAWLEQSGLAEKTVKTHVDNINILCLGLFANLEVLLDQLKMFRVMLAD